jgi:hypothetical protein
MLLRERQVLPLPRQLAQVQSILVCAFAVGAYFENWA